MANKKVTKSDAPVAQPATPQVSKAEKAPKQQKEKAPKKSKKEEVVEEEEVLEEESEETTTDDKTKKRVVPTRESVLASFDELIASVEAEIQTIRDSSSKTKGVKFLRSLNKKLKTLKNQSSRVKHRTSTKTSSATNNANSGFLKPVKISSEMAKFTGWEPKSRVDVTKYICNYIKEHELQNPKDKRQILADSKLSKLLNYDPKKESEPLTYYRIQSYIKPHFIKTEAAH